VIVCACRQTRELAPPLHVLLLFDYPPSTSKLSVVPHALDARSTSSYEAEESNVEGGKGGA
jgi:hypothetical protein